MFSDLHVLGTAPELFRNCLGVVLGAGLGVCQDLVRIWFMSCFRSYLSG